MNTCQKARIDLQLAGRAGATDGHCVQPVDGKVFPIALAQRLDLLIDLPGSGAFPFSRDWKAPAGRPGSCSPLRGPISRA